MLVCLAALATSAVFLPAQLASPASGVMPRHFRAGAATANITPRLGISINGHFNDRVAKHVHDELHARCLVLDDGLTRLAIVVCDSCMIPREVMDAAKALIQQRTGIPSEGVLISATHTHSAPTCTGVFQSEPDSEYQGFLAARIADGVQRAINHSAPAKIGWGVGREPNQVFNRRWRMRPGAIPPNPFGGTNDLVRMNPPVESPDLIEPAGPTDPEVSVLAVQSQEGRPVALLATYSLHYVGAPGFDISADYFGAFCDRLQQLLGADRLNPPFVAMLANGTSGDINNINFRQKRPPQKPYEQINLVADAVAREAQRVYRELKFQDWVPLGVAQHEITLGVRRPDAAELRRAGEILAKTNGRELRGAEEIYARETVLLKDYPEKVPLIIQTMRIGDLGIAAIPCEVFVEIGLEIKARSPFKPTFTISLANGYNGYLPTPEHHKLGGYETWRARSSYLEVDAAPKIVDTVMELFARWR
ncbi:MAG: neutral/alkaline non-lysosomal ceramidase N-terminal domain-containing protein [Verrucomicrobiae bacterium]|nr:neutral/alkaline non-lysosomal ceramidase N-terminal domain-containing protein [Verrucomicrobiae bacterium]